MLQRSLVRVWASIGACVVALSAIPAQAASFSVDPTIVTLGKSNSSQSIAVTNQSTQPLRLQLSGFAWHQKSTGEMQLTKTPDLVFFPQLISLKPGETRRIRVGVTGAQGPLEQSYRIFLEELPSLASVIHPRSASISIRVKVGVPIFLSPSAPPVVRGVVDHASVRDGMLSFDVRNTGNVHFSIQHADVSAKNTAGASLFSKDVTGWYVLPGETRHFALPISTSACDALKSFSVRVDAGALKFGKSFPDPSKQCVSATRS